MNIVTQHVAIPDQGDIFYTFSEGKKSFLPILFLHGWGGEGKRYQPLMESVDAATFENHGDMLAIDFPGFGQTPEPPTPWTIQDYALCVVKYLDALNIHRVHLVCHSFGGRVSAVLLSHYPERFATATCIAPAGIYHKSQKALIAGQLSGVLKSAESLPLLGKCVRALRGPLQRLLGARDYAKTSGVMRETFKLVIAQDTTPLLSKITQPMLLFFGVHDSYVPVADAYVMQKLIPQIDLTIFPDGKHGLHFTHKTEIAEKMKILIQTV